MTLVPEKGRGEGEVGRKEVEGSGGRREMEGGGGRWSGRVVENGGAGKRGGEGGGGRRYMPGRSATVELEVGWAGCWVLALCKR